MGKFFLYLFGLAFLAYALFTVGQELKARLEIEQVKAQAALSAARADEAIAEALRAQAEALQAQALAQLRESERKSNFYFFLFFLIAAWAVFMVAVLVLVIFYLLRQQNNQVVYLPKEEEVKAFQPGQSIAVWLSPESYLIENNRGEYVRR